MYLWIMIKFCWVAMKEELLARVNITGCLAPRRSCIFWCDARRNVVQKIRTSVPGGLLAGCGNLISPTIKNWMSSREYSSMIKFNRICFFKSLEFWILFIESKSLAGELYSNYRYAYCTWNENKWALF